MSAKKFSSASPNRTSTSQQHLPLSKSTHDTRPKVEYKEYDFKTNTDKNIEQKVATFWKHIVKVKPPKSEYFKTPEIYKCLEDIQDEYTIKDNQSSQILNQKWTNTYCLMKIRGLKQTATTAVVSKCPLCHNDGFAPKWADEQCLELVIDHLK